MRGRRRVAAPVAVTAALVLALLIAGGLYVRATTNRLQGAIAAEFKAGQQALESGKGLLKAANQNRRADQVQAANMQFAQARQHFVSGRAIADGSRLLSVTSRLPLVGLYVNPRLQAVDNLSQMGVDLSDGATTLGQVDLRFISSTGHATAGEKLLSVLQGAQPDVKKAYGDFVAAQAAANRIDASVLPTQERSALVNARGTIDKGVAGIGAFQKLAPTLMDIFGGNGARTYVVEQVNPSELRSGGGFIGTVSILKADSGKLHLNFSGDTYQFDGAAADQRPTAGQPGYVAPPVSYMPDFFLRTWTLEDSNFFPNFATNAKWAEFFVKHVRGEDTQGVIAMDYYAVASLLEVTGPITVPEFGLTFDSKNFADLVFQRSVDRDPTHKAILTATAGPLIEKISTLPPDRWSKLAEVMNKAILARHLQVYFNSATVEPQMRSFGWSPDINPARAGDFMLETEDNYGATKTNHYVVRKYAVTLTKVGIQLHRKIVIDITDNAPPPVYPSNYSCYLRFYTGDSASNLQLSRVPSTVIWSVPPADQAKFELPPGIQFTHTRFDIRPAGGQPGHMVVTIEYDQPWTADSAGNHEVYWQKQPGTLDDAVDITWVDGGHSFHTSGSLSGDRLITLNASGVKLEPAQSATAQLPQLGF